MPTSEPHPVKRLPLPELSFSVTCDHCGHECDADSDGWTCDQCGLYWTPAGACYFQDEELAPCGEPSGQPPVTLRGRVYHHVPCPLPKGHLAPEHYHPYVAEEDLP